MYFDMSKRGITVLELPPNELMTAIANNQIQGGLIPLIATFNMDDSMRTLPGFCLATVAQSGSVKLHSKIPIIELDGKSVAVPTESPTSVKLLEVLLEVKHGVKPAVYVNETEPHEAQLLVGNLGLRHRRGLREHPHIYDLGEEWNQWTRLPFVFARWVLRYDVERSDALAIEDSLFTSLQDWTDGLYRVLGPAIPLPIHPQEIHMYTQGLRYFMGRPEEKSVIQFQEYVDQLRYR